MDIAQQGHCDRTPISMFVLPVQKVLGLDKLKTHEEMSSSLVEWKRKPPLNRCTVPARYVVRESSMSSTAGSASPPPIRGSPMVAALGTRGVWLVLSSSETLYLHAHDEYAPRPYICTHMTKTLRNPIFART